MASYPNPGDYDWAKPLNVFLGQCVTLTDPQTLTNKTLTAPTLTSPTITGVGAKGWAYRTTTQTVTSSTVLVNDDTMSFAVVNAGVYDAMVTLRVGPSGAGANGQIKVGFLGPAASAFTVEGIGPSTALTTLTAATVESVSQRTASGTTSTATPYGVSQTASTYVSIKIRALIIAGANGTVNLQWAQNSSSAVGTIVDVGSFLRWERIA